MSIFVASHCDDGHNDDGICNATFTRMFNTYRKHISKTYRKRM